MLLGHAPVDWTDAEHVDAQASRSTAVDDGGRGRANLDTAIRGDPALADDLGER